MERWIERHVAYEGRIITLTHGTVELDDGHRTQREVIEHPGAVGVVPFTGTSVILVRQFRIAARKNIIEIPAGKLERADLSAEARGRIELEEETGYTAGTMRAVGAFYPSAGILTEVIRLFIATDLKKSAQKLESDERIEVIEMPLADVRNALREHEFEDAKTIIGLHALLDHLGARV